MDSVHTDRRGGRAANRSRWPKVRETGRQRGEQRAGRSARGRNHNATVDGLADVGHRINKGRAPDRAGRKVERICSRSTRPSGRAMRGDAGKNFAVVASEVKQLATQTKSATEGDRRPGQQHPVGDRAVVTTIRGITSAIAGINRRVDERLCVGEAAAGRGVRHPRQQRTGDSHGDAGVEATSRRLPRRQKHTRSRRAAAVRGERARASRRDAARRCRHLPGRRARRLRTERRGPDQRSASAPKLRVRPCGEQHRGRRRGGAFDGMARGQSLPAVDGDAHQPSRDQPIHDAGCPTGRRCADRRAARSRAGRARCRRAACRRRQRGSLRAADPERDTERVHERGRRAGGHPM